MHLPFLCKCIPMLSKVPSCPDSIPQYNQSYPPIFPRIMSPKYPTIPICTCSRSPSYPTVTCIYISVYCCSNFLLLSSYYIDLSPNFQISMIRRSHGSSWAVKPLVCRYLYKYAYTEHHITIELSLNHKTYGIRMYAIYYDMM